MLKAMRREAAPALPQEGFGWPGGRAFVHTTMWYLGFGIDSPLMVYETVSIHLSCKNWPRADCCLLMTVSLRRVRLPYLDGLFWQLPMLEALHHPIEIVRLGFELTDWGCSIGGDEHFVSGLREHS